jgi:hypothetical protein
MKTRTTALALSACLAAAAVLASPQHTEVPKPGPEHQKLGYFVGEWKSEGEMKPGPMGPGGKVTGTSRCKWLPGNFFVTCEDSASSPMGQVAGLGVLGYNPAKKVYTWNGYNNMGQAEAATGTINGKTWTYTGDADMGGKIYKSRYVMVETSPTVYTFSMDLSEDGKTWNKVMDGTVTKK